MNELFCCKFAFQFQKDSESLKVFSVLYNYVWHEKIPLQFGTNSFFNNRFMMVSFVQCNTNGGTIEDLQQT